MPPKTRVNDVEVRGTAKIKKAEVKDLEIDGHDFTEVLDRLRDLELRVTALET